MSDDNPRDTLVSRVRHTRPLSRDTDIPQPGSGVTLHREPWWVRLGAWWRARKVRR